MWMRTADRMVIQAAMTIKALVAALEAVDQPHSSVTELLEAIKAWRGQATRPR